MTSEKEHQEFIRLYGDSLCESNNFTALREGKILINYETMSLITSDGISICMYIDKNCSKYKDAKINAHGWVLFDSKDTEKLYMEIYNKKQIFPWEILFKYRLPNYICKEIGYVPMSGRGTGIWIVDYIQAMREAFTYLSLKL